MRHSSSRVRVGDDCWFTRKLYRKLTTVDENRAR
jgi:hypothetical protein